MATPPVTPAAWLSSRSDGEVAALVRPRMATTVIYLNGTEIQRFYMPTEPALISNSTLASGYLWPLFVLSVPSVAYALYRTTRILPQASP